MSLAVSPKPGSELSLEEVACAIVFLTVDFQSVLASNQIRYIAEINNVRAKFLFYQEVHASSSPRESNIFKLEH